MADPRQYQYLLARLARHDGCQSWQKFKNKARWIDLSTSDLSGRDLSGYDLSGINLSTALLGGAILRGADFSGANLSFADLRGADLRGARLEQTDLTSANMHDTCLADAVLTSANLKGARLIGADLLGADLVGANMTGADLRGAMLRYSDLSRAAVDGANVAEANISGALLPAGAAEKWQNESMAVRSELFYRSLPGRLTGIEPLPEPAVAVATIEAASETESAAEEADKTSPLEIPVRTIEPDLGTLQGCALVLGIAPDAGQADVVRAFRRKAKLFHPDKVRHLGEKEQALATEEFHRILVAYERMTGHERRPLVGIAWVPGVPRFSSPYEYTVEHYEALVAANPNNVNLLYNLAWKYFDEGQSDKAYAGFQRVLAIDPNDEDAMYNLMVVRLYQELLLPSPAFKALT